LSLRRRKECSVAKALLLSVVIGLVAVPAWCAREPNPMRALKRAVFFTFVLNVGYLIALRYVLPRL
jgi:hypothetical protein